LLSCRRQDYARVFNNDASFGGEFVSIDPIYISGPLGLVGDGYLSLISKIDFASPSAGGPLASDFYSQNKNKNKARLRSNLGCYLLR